MIFTEEHIVNLPEPLQKYLKWSGCIGTVIPRKVSLKQQGDFKMNGKRWVKLKARQLVDLDNCEFVWKARTGIISVVDQFVKNKGSLIVKLMGLVRLAKAEGPEINEGEAQRLLAELIWYPTFVVSDKISWSEPEPLMAEATFTYDLVKTVKVLFHFDELYRLQTITAKRYQELNGSFKISDWLIDHFEYKEFDGVKMPYKAWVSWRLPEEDLCYYKLEITELIRS